MSRRRQGARSVRRRGPARVFLGGRDAAGLSSGDERCPARTPGDREPPGRRAPVGRRRLAGGVEDPAADERGRRRRSSGESAPATPAPTRAPGRSASRRAREARRARVPCPSPVSTSATAPIRSEHETRSPRLAHRAMRGADRRELLAETRSTMSSAAAPAPSAARHSRSPGTRRPRARGRPRPESAEGRARAPPCPASKNIRWRDMRTLSSGTRGGRPVERARQRCPPRRRRAGSSAAAGASATGRPVSRASASRISFSVMLRLPRM